MKLALGSVQFGLDYGVANTKSLMKLEEVKELLEFALESDIDTLDTAITYGKSEYILGQIGVSSWKVISKLPAIPDNCIDIQKWVLSQALSSIQKLGVTHLHGFLLHYPAQLLEDRGIELYAALELLKKKGLTEKIGISIYSPAELDLLLERYVFDLVQAPVNILDRSLEESGWAHKLKKAGVEIHTRSTFLQGLLLIPPDARPFKFMRWIDFWNEWDQWLSSVALTPLEACLSYTNSLSFADRVIIGVDSIDQLKAIILASKDHLPSLPIFKPLFDERLINPSSWNYL
jgi:aryl-alcohol dehydrogenase-like predicted oxidoreductase